MRYADLDPADLIADGDGWEVFRVAVDDPRFSHVVVEVVHRASGRSVASYDETPADRMDEPVSVGRLRHRTDSWWCLAVRPDVAVLELDAVTVELVRDELPRHLLRRADGPLRWSAQLADGTTAVGTTSRHR